jgi:hypothetical protein
MQKSNGPSEGELEPSSWNVTAGDSGDQKQSSQHSRMGCYGTAIPMSNGFCP